MTRSQRLQDLAGRFVRFAERECVSASPLYYALSRAIAGDDALLALAAEAPKEQPAPNLLFAAVHYLLRREPEAPLAGCYASLTAAPRPPAAAPPLFRAFCMSHQDAITALLRCRAVGTNEVARCACLFPAFVAALAATDAARMHFLEIGASAGLNLLWPWYSYDYGESLSTAGDALAPTIKCELRGGEPPLALDRSRLGRIVGVDLRPMDVADQDDADWLSALVWPEQRQRRTRLVAAIAFAREAGPTVERGDGVEAVPRFATSLPQGDALCVAHSFTLNQVPDKLRHRLDDHLAVLSRSRPVLRVSMEWEGPAVTVKLVRYRPEPQAQLLAEADAHGAWLRWLA